MQILKTPLHQRVENRTRARKVVTCFIAGIGDERELWQMRKASDQRRIAIHKQKFEGGKR